MVYVEGRPVAGSGFQAGLVLGGIVGRLAGQGARTMVGQSNTFSSWCTAPVQMVALARGQEVELRALPPLQNGTVTDLHFCVRG